MGEPLECQYSEPMTLRMSLSLDGTLSADGEHQLQRHLATCSSCRAEWAAMQEVSALFEHSPMVGPPLGFAVRVERVLEDRSKKRRRVFGGMAVLTGSLPLAGMTVALVTLVVLGIVGWFWLGAAPAVQQGFGTVSQVAAVLGLVGKGASFFLGEILLRYGPPVVLLLGIGLVLLTGMWTWVFLRRSGGSRRNGYV